VRSVLMLAIFAGAAATLGWVAASAAEAVLGSQEKAGVGNDGPAGGGESVPASGAAGAGSTEKAEGELAIKPQKNERVLRLLTVFGDEKQPWEQRRQAAEQLKKMENGEVLPGLAWVLGREEYRKAALDIVHTYVPDKRLAPFVADCIQETEGHVLLRAVQAAGKIPDRRYLAPLIEHALTSDYERTVRTAGPGGRVETMYVGVFRESAELLFRLTDGKIGWRDGRTDRLIHPNENARLAREWRAWWEEQKENQQASKEEGKAGEKASGEKPGPTTLVEVKPVADEALWKVFQTVLVECTDYEARVKAVREAIQKDRERALSAVAFYLGQEATRGDALRFVWHLRDSRLIPFVVEAMRRSDGRTLLEAVRTARKWGDRRFLPVLIEHALDSEGVFVDGYPEPSGGMVWEYQSVFAEAAAAIYAITKGWAGSDQYLHKPQPPKEERNALTAQWRKWWTENKAKYEAGTPFEENPSAPVKPPEPPA